MELAKYFFTTNNVTNQAEMSEMWADSMIFLERLYLGRKFLAIFITVFTILGNALVLIVTWRERSLHQPNKYFIALLAVADLLVGLFVAPFLAYQSDLESKLSSRKNMSIHLCRFMVWIDTFALTTSIYSLTFISFDRYLKISKPLRYKSRISTFKSMKIIFVIVLISTAFATYSATPQSGSRGILGTGNGPCSWSAGFNKSATYTLFLAISTFFLPILIILIMYTLIFLVAHKRNKMLANGELGQTINNQNLGTALSRDMKVIKMLLVVVGVFLICWCPRFTWLLILYYYPNFVDHYASSLSFRYRIQVFDATAMTLPLFNSLCNPIIYVCLDKTYREAFKHLFRRMMCRQDARIQQPPIELRSLRA